MSEQYPDGPYLVTNGEGFYAAGVLCTDAGQNRYLPGIGTLNGLLREGCALTPLFPVPTEPTLAAIRELCNCVDVVAAAPFAMPELAGAYLDDVATVRAWLDSYRGREP